ncbi:MAG: hypothetical protein WCA84_04460 [Ignavibacteriaceae bacterium]
MRVKITTSNLRKVVQVRNVHEYEKTRDFEPLMTWLEKWLTGLLIALADRKSFNLNLIKGVEYAS